MAAPDRFPVAAGHRVSPAGAGSRPDRRRSRRCRCRGAVTAPVVSGASSLDEAAEARSDVDVDAATSAGVSVSECSMSEEFPSQGSCRLGAPPNRDRPRRAAGLGWYWRSGSPGGGPVRALRPQAKAVRCAMTDSTAPLAQLLAELVMGEVSVDRGHWEEILRRMAQCGRMVTRNVRRTATWSTHPAHVHGLHEPEHREEHDDARTPVGDERQRQSGRRA